MYIGFAKDNKEVSKAINLATKIFRSKENFDEALRSKRIIMFQKVKPDLQNVIVIKNFDEDLIGTCFLIDRLFYRGKLNFKELLYLQFVSMNDIANLDIQNYLLSMQ